MTFQLMMWLGLTILAWGVFSFAVKCSTLYFQNEKYGIRNTLVYQPFGFLGAALVYSYYTIGLQLETSWLGVLWSFLAGVFLGLGLVFYVKAMDAKEISIVTPLTALYPVVTILISLVVLQEAVSPLHVIGILLSVVAIWVLNGGRFKMAGLSMREPWFRYALLTMICWGIFALFPRLSLDHMGASSGIVYQSVGYVVGGCVTGLFMTNGRPQINVLGISFALMGGLGSFAGGVFYLYALKFGSVAIVAPASSLFPIVTMGLARLFIGERLTAVQRVGVLLSLTAVVLINI